MGSSGEGLSSLTAQCVSLGFLGDIQAVNRGLGFSSLWMVTEPLDRDNMA